MNVLVTGGWGFIGMYVTQQLIEKGHEVVIFDPLAKPPAGTEKNFEGAQGFRGDLLNQLSLFEAVEKHHIDRIIHLAAFRNVDSQINPYRAFKLNCEGTLNCFEVARVCGLDRVVFASSSAASGTVRDYEKYGINISDGTIKDDDIVYRPRNVYGITKEFDEQMAVQYCDRYDMNIIGVRLSLIYGAGKKAGSATSIWNDMIEKSITGEPLDVPLTGNRYTINYGKDAAKAAVCAALAENPENGTYNTSGWLTDNEDFVGHIRNVLPKCNIRLIKKEVDPKALGVSGFDCTLAKTAIGFEPSYTLEQGIEDHARMVTEK